MTYFTYKKAQRSDYKPERRIPFFRPTKNGPEVVNIEGDHRYTQPPKRMPLILPKPIFMPSYLVRTSDMKVVKGSEVHEGYCTLSYSWNQSGETRKDAITGKSYRVDEGKHKIIFPGKTVRIKPRGRKRIPRRIKFVKFEALIQEICKDFNVKYIWYDQLCINQGDEEEKHGEIRQMHKIYKNAYCAVALVPELKTMSDRPTQVFISGADSQTLLNTQWVSRMWTLEEALMSSRLLYIGCDNHCWWYRLARDGHPVFSGRVKRDVASVLYYAHARTSTKEHDHVFALANVFPDVMKDITVNYKQDIQKLMIQFYGHLAEKDLTILCFQPHTSHGYKKMCRTFFSGSIGDNDTKEEGYEVPIQSFDLPSWTGVAGEHIHGRGYSSDFKSYTAIGRTLQVTCNGMTNQRLTEASDDACIIPDDIPPLPQNDMSPVPQDDIVLQFEAEISSLHELAIRVRLPGATDDILVQVYGAIRKKEQINKRICNAISKKLQLLSHFMLIKKANFQWVSIEDTSAVSFNFNNLIETIQASDQYVLLAGIQFKIPEKKEHSIFPVIKKNGTYYTSIGVCTVYGPVDALNKVKAEGTFKIC